ncbi:MAG: TRAP transporter small permease [Vannielia sp.]|uniref:TRAP transporter small permease n=1 Tax=Vannielia sp. TaxID=2813045 RepID=UPI003B8CBBF4
MSGSAHSTPAARHGGNPLLRGIGALSMICGVIAAFLIVAAVGITCQMIFIRWVLNGSTVWQTEGVTYIVIAATMLGLPYVQHQRGHVNVDLLPLMLPAAARKALAIFVQLLTLAVIGMMLFYGYEFWHEAWDWGETSNSPWNPKLWMPYLALPLGFGLYTLQVAADLWALLAGHDTPFGLDPEAGFTDGREGH